jgi:hypothetical protein
LEEKLLLMELRHVDRDAARDWALCGRGEKQVAKLAVDGSKRYWKSVDGAFFSELAIQSFAFRRVDVVVENVLPDHPFGSRMTGRAR